MRPVMLATDGSPSAEAATEKAFELARVFGAPLIAVTVAHAPVPAFGSAAIGYGDLVNELRKAELVHIEQVLGTVRDRAAAAGIDCDTVALDGVPGEQICREAAALDARLVVIGAHGWGRVGRFVHGSVSTYVLHHATCPVLVVRSGDAAVRTHRDLDVHAVAH